ncbi:hypothetical protein AB0K60_15700 [Thermopolyspora sp. NPDC052614]
MNLSIRQAAILRPRRQSFSDRDRIAAHLGQIHLCESALLGHHRLREKH